MATCSDFDTYSFVPSLPFQCKGCLFVPQLLSIEHATNAVSSRSDAKATVGVTL